MLSGDTRVNGGEGLDKLSISKKFLKHFYAFI